MTKTNAPAAAPEPVPAETARAAAVEDILLRAIGMIPGAGDLLAEAKALLRPEPPAEGDLT